MPRQMHPPGRQKRSPRVVPLGPSSRSRRGHRPWLRRRRANGHRHPCAFLCSRSTHHRCWSRQCPRRSPSGAVINKDALTSSMLTITVFISTTWSFPTKAACQFFRQKGRGVVFQAAQAPGCQKSRRAAPRSEPSSRLAWPPGMSLRCRRRSTGMAQPSLGSSTRLSSRPATLRHRWRGGSGAAAHPHHRSGPKHASGSPVGVPDHRWQQELRCARPRSGSGLSHHGPESGVMEESQVLPRQGGRRN